MSRSTLRGRRGESRPGSGERAYVMLAALVIVALAFVVVGTCLALVSSATRVRAADLTSARALALAETGLADARERVRWGWAGLGATGLVERLDTVTVPEGAYAIAVERVAEPLPAGPAQPAVGASMPSSASSPSALAPYPPGARWYRVEVEAEAGRARHQLHALLVVSPTALPRGVAIAGDLEAADLVMVSGAGLYAEGDVKGREHIAFDSPTGLDEARPESFGSPGVHAGGGIFVGGAEEHAGGVPPASDSDPHAGGAPPDSTWRLPGPGVLGDLAVHATSAGAALVGDRLLLDALPPAPDSAGAGGSADGVIVVVSAPASAGGVRIEGVRPSPPAACALTLVVEGDATVSAPAALSGELVVTGTLSVEMPLTVSGSLAAGARTVASPVRVALAPGWAERPAPGSLATTVTWWSDAPQP